MLDFLNKDSRFVDFSVRWNIFDFEFTFTILLKEYWTHSLLARLRQFKPRRIHSYTGSFQRCNQSKILDIRRNASRRKWLFRLFSNDIKK